MPFTQEIMEVLISPHFLIPKMTPFSGAEDPENHSKAFQTQMLISDGSDSACYKMLLRNFRGMNLKWFSGIHDGTINSFCEFSKMFEEQFTTNWVKPS